MSQQGLVVFAKNKKRVTAFYQQTLDLDLADTGPSHDLLWGMAMKSLPTRSHASIRQA